MELHLSTQVKNALDYIQTIDVTEIKNELEAGRAFYEKFIPMAGEKEPIFKMENLATCSSDQTINIRLYRPSDKAVLPAVLYFHGGWFNAGTLETLDTPLIKLANLSGAVIISVEYRLAPEYPFPNGLNDCYKTLEWVIANAKQLGIDASRLAIAGDSAGGALAAVTTRLAVENKLPGVLCQVLVYPVTDSSLATPSWQHFKDGPVLNYDGAIEAWNFYAPAEEIKKDPDAAPLYAENLSGLPPALVIAAEYDPLRDEAILYAEKMEASGVNVQLSLYSGMPHGFFQMGGIIENGNRAIEEVAQFLIKYLYL